MSESIRDWVSVFAKCLPNSERHKLDTFVTQYDEAHKILKSLEEESEGLVTKGENLLERVEKLKTHGEGLDKRINVMETSIDIKDKYNELIMAVGNKYPGESRHETALRYIKRAEHVDSGPAKESA